MFPGPVLPVCIAGRPTTIIFISSCSCPWFWGCWQYAAVTENMSGKICKLCPFPSGVYWNVNVFWQLASARIYLRQLIPAVTRWWMKWAQCSTRFPDISPLLNHSWQIRRWWLDFAVPEPTLCSSALVFSFFIPAAITLVLLTRVSKTPVGAWLLP